MNLHNKGARVLIPDGCPKPEAFRRTTHLGIGAHQDDLEFMALHGIFECHNSTEKWFGGVTCTNGGGSARTGIYADYTNEQMSEVRIKEQEEAARTGRYAFIAQLDYPSREVKDPKYPHLRTDLVSILSETRPSVVYTHNPADKHDTHIGVTLATIQALRDLSGDYKPERVLGCEVWRGLDWMPDNDKVVLDVSGAEELAKALNAAFASQIAGGKRYDLAVLGRQLANATFFESHAADDMDHAWYAMDLTPLIENPELDIAEYTTAFIAKFMDDVRRKLKK